MASNQEIPSLRNENLPPEDIRQVEKWISSARDYVIPTDDLRPRVLEAAGKVVDCRLQERRIGYAIISIAIACVCWAGLWFWITNLRTGVISESADTISRRALELHDRDSIGIHQATVDAYEEWRARSHRSLSTVPVTIDEQTLTPDATAGSMFNMPFRNFGNSTR